MVYNVPKQYNFTKMEETKSKIVTGAEKAIKILNKYQEELEQKKQRWEEQKEERVMDPYRCEDSPMKECERFISSLKEKVKNRTTMELNYNFNPIRPGPAI